MLGKNQTKILLRYYEKALSNISVTIRCLHKPPYCFTLPCFVSVYFAVISSKPFSFFWIFLCKNSSSTKTTDSRYFLLKTTWPSHSLFLISIILHSLSLNYSIKSSVGKETSFGFQWKLCCYSPPSHMTQENVVSRSCFCLSFVFLLFFWSLDATTTNFQGFTHSNLSN